MISRVAESCFWLQRHVERCDSTARLLEVHLGLLLDVDLPPRERWRPLLIVSGEEPHFFGLYGERKAQNGDFVLRYLTWDEANPVSIYSSAYWARENARIIRETLSLEAWEAINAFWLWLRDGDGRRLWEKEREVFYARIKESAVLFRGVCQDTMLHETPFDFLRLGQAVERAGQTARILDMKFHQMGRTRPRDVENVDELTLWESVLRSLNAAEAFQKRGYALEGSQVARFLLLEPVHPRSIRHNVERAWNFLGRVRPVRGAGYPSARRLRALRDELRTATVDDILAAGLHPFLTHVVDTVTEICDAIYHDFFDPSPVGRGDPA